MAYRKTAAELKAELAESRRTIRELEDENEDLQDRLDEIAGIVVEDDEEEDGDDEDGDEDETDDEEVATAC